jgi:hypothetical protein
MLCVTEVFTKHAWLVISLLIVWFEGEESQLKLYQVILHQMMIRIILNTKLQKYNGCRHIWHESDKWYAVAGNHHILVKFDNRSSWFGITKSQINKKRSSLTKRCSLVWHLRLSLLSINFSSISGLKIWIWELTQILVNFSTGILRFKLLSWRFFQMINQRGKLKWNCKPNSFE